MTVLITAAIRRTMVELSGQSKQSDKALENRTFTCLLSVNRGLRHHQLEGEFLRLLTDEPPSFIDLEVCLIVDVDVDTAGRPCALPLPVRSG
jgi:hypothetical protein